MTRMSQAALNEVLHYEYDEGYEVGFRAALKIFLNPTQDMICQAVGAMQRKCDVLAPAPFNTDPAIWKDGMQVMYDTYMLNHPSKHGRPS